MDDRGGLPTLLQGGSLTIPPEVEKTLTTWQSRVDFDKYCQTVSNTSAWMRADNILGMFKQWGDNSIASFAYDIGAKESTVRNYMKTAEIFPPDLRSPQLHFSHYFALAMAANADQELFNQEKCLELVKKVEQGDELSNFEPWSVRRLGDEIDKIQHAHTLGVEHIPCDHCGESNGDVDPYIFYSPSYKRQSDRFYYHRPCYETVREELLNHGKN